MAQTQLGLQVLQAAESPTLKEKKKYQKQQDY